MEKEEWIDAECTGDRRRNPGNEMLMVESLPWKGSELQRVAQFVFAVSFLTSIHFPSLNFLLIFQSWSFTEEVSSLPNPLSNLTT